MRRVLSLVLCLLMLVAVFAGCSRTTTEEPAKTEETKTSEPAESKEPEGGEESVGTPVGNGTLVLGSDPVEITFWIPVNDVDDMSEEQKTNIMWHGIVDDFQAKYPNVTVKLEGVGADDSENTAVWNTAAAANNLPELVYTVGGYIVNWQDAGIVVDYSEYLSDDYYAAYRESVIPTANVYAEKEGAVYVTPCCQEVEGWVFNTSILSENDCEIPTTFDELVEVCETLRANGVTPIAHGGADTWAIWGYHEFTNQYGWTKEQCDQFVAQEINVRETAFCKAFEMCYTLAQAGCYAPDAATTKNSAASEQWAAGLAAIWQTYDGYRHKLMQVYDSDPEAYATYYTPLMESEFRMGFETPDDIFEDGEVHGCKMFNWGVFIGSCAEQDPQKLAACVAFLEFMVSEEAYPHWVKASSSIPVVWTSDESYDYSMWGLEQSYYEAYVAEGTFFEEPPVWCSRICDDYRNAITGLICGTLDVEGACEIFDTWQVSNAIA